MTRRLVLAIPLLAIFLTYIWGSSNSTNSFVSHAAPPSTARGECGTVLDCAQTAVQSAKDANAAADRATAAFPAGTVVAFAGKKPPLGWLLCNGDTIPREGIYANLFIAIGETYGKGNGKETFAIPDYRGRFLRGIDQDGAGGQSKVDQDRLNKKDGLGSLQDESLKRHHHDSNAQKFSEAGPNPAWEHYFGFGAGQSLAIPVGVKVSTEETGGTETRPTNVAVNWIIKY